MRRVERTDGRTDGEMDGREGGNDKSLMSIGYRGSRRAYGCLATGFVYIGWKKLLNSADKAL